MYGLPLILCLLGTDVAGANRLYAEGRYREAAIQYSQILSGSPASVEALLGMGKSLVGMRAFRQALPYLQRAQQLDSENRGVKRTLAHALAESGQFFAAEEMLKRLTAADAKDEESWFYLGALYYKNGYYGAALPALEHALAVQPRNSQASVYHAVCLAKLGRGREAEEAFLKLLEDPANERDPDLLLVYAELLYDTKRTDEALRRVDEALRATPDSPMAFFWKAKILFGADRLKPASEAAEEAIRLAPELPFAHVLLMNIYQALGRSDAAAAQAEWLRRREPPEPPR